MNRLAVAALALPLFACAAHNHHRVPIDLNADLAPLIDEAWAVMETELGEPVPLGATPIEVEVEDVDVQWLPCSPEVPPGGSTLAQSEMKKTIEDVLRPPAAVEGATRRVHVELATDLHEPDVLEIQVECALIDTAEDRVLARGWSTIVHFERLYCHGCREHWSGHGTSLAEQHAIPGAAGCSGFLIFSAPGCSSPGYVKN